MRFIYGLIAGFVWIIILSLFNDNETLKQSDTATLTLAIVVAGAMAGGG